MALQKQLQSFLKNTHYVLGSIWHEESNRKQRVKRLFLFFGWQVWKRVVQRPLVVKLFNGLQFQAHPDCQVSSAVLYARIPDWCPSSLPIRFNMGCCLNPIQSPPPVRERI